MDLTLRCQPELIRPASDPDGLLDGRVRPIRAVEKKGPSRHQRRLCEKARARTAMLLSRMHQKWMAQVDGAGVACREVSAKPSVAARSLADKPLSPAGERILAISRCEPTRMRVGASLSPTSEKRNSIRRALPLENTLTRQFRKSLVSPRSGGKLPSTCQPASPGSSGDGNRIGNVPRSLRGRHRPGPTS